MHLSNTSLVLQISMSVSHDRYGKPSLCGFDIILRDYICMGLAGTTFINDIRHSYHPFASILAATVRYTIVSLHPTSQISLLVHLAYLFNKRLLNGMYVYRILGIRLHRGNEDGGNVLAWSALNLVLIVCLDWVARFIHEPHTVWFGDIPMGPGYSR